MQNENPQVKQLFPGLKSSDWAVRVKTAEELGQICDARAVEPLIELFNDSDANGLVCRRAISAIVRIGTPAVEALIVALDSSEFVVREGAAEALGQIGDKRAVEPLITLLLDRRIWRSEFARALGRIGDVRAVEPLIEASMSCDGGASLRHRAAEALARMGDIRGIEVLIAMLRDEAESCRANARRADDHHGFYLGEVAFSLGSLHVIRAIEPLAEALADWQTPDRANWRRSVACALWMLGAPAINPLFDAIRRDPTNMSALAAQDAFSVVYAHSASCLTDIGAINPLRAALKDKDEYVRTIAAKALEILGGRT